MCTEILWIYYKNADWIYSQEYRKHYYVKQFKYSSFMVFDHKCGSTYRVLAISLVLNAEKPTYICFHSFHPHVVQLNILKPW